MKKVSIIVSVFNEEGNVSLFNEKILDVLENGTFDWELLYINDGSTDNSFELLLSAAEKNSQIKIINFSRNFGHEAAMIAGIDYCSGEYAICMDADLQHPVELIPKIISKFEEGYEVITMKRTKNKSAGSIKNITSLLFYKVLNKFSQISFEENASDFFAISHKPITILQEQYREKIRFLRGYIQSLGFKRTSIEYVAAKRNSGESKYKFKKLLQFSENALLSFSDIPLKVSGLFSGFAALTGLAVLIYTIAVKVTVGAPAGYSTIIVIICFMFAMLFFLNGIIGEYIGMIFTEVKNRPIYIVSDVMNIIPKDNPHNDFSRK